MKRSLFQIFFFFLLSSFFFFSCKETSREKILIEKAAKLADSIPEQALVSLDSIPNPESLEYDLYMKYILICTQAKWNAEQDLSSDTLIFEAEKYFDSKNNPHLSALAHYYAGNVYYVRDQGDLSLNSFLQARDYAQQTDDYQLLAKCLNNIGYRYLMNELKDSAVVYLREAVDCYQNIRETDKSERLKMQTFYSLGTAYYVINSFDSAYVSYDKALGIAKKLEDKEYQGILTSHLGLPRRMQARYDESLMFLYAGLPQVKTPEDSLRIYINLSLDYNKLGKQDSSKYYTGLIENRLSQINNKLILWNAFSILKEAYITDHFYSEALKYADLERKVEQQIKEENSTRKLLEAEKKYALAQKEKEIEANKRQLYLTYLGGSAAILFIILVFAYAYRRSKRELNSIQTEINRILHLRESPRDNSSNLEDLFEWSRCYILEQPLGEKLAAILSSKEILFTVLWVNDYSKEVIAAILNMSLTGIETYKMKLEDTLRNGGLTDFQIEEIFDRNEE
jgi:tetratricopeptide (TPR) repeat protein